jgi:hypothetical protein
LKSPADEPLSARILQKFIQDGGGQVRFYTITDWMEFLATKADRRFFANDVRLKAVHKLLQEHQQRRKHPQSQKCQPSKSTAQNNPLPLASSVSFHFIYYIP